MLPMGPLALLKIYKVLFSSNNATVFSMTHRIFLKCVAWGRLALKFKQKSIHNVF